MAPSAPLLLAAAAWALCLALAAALVTARFRRTRAERLAQALQGSFADALARAGDGGAEAIGHALTRDRGRRTTRVDALIAALLALRAADPAAAPRLAAESSVRGLATAVARTLGHRDAALRGRAALVLGLLGGPRVVERLEPLLRDRDPDVRLTAARALAAVADHEAAWALIRALRDEALDADRLVERLGRPWAARALDEAFEQAQFRPVRAALAEALGLSGAASAASVLARLVRIGEEEERIRACRALGATRDARYAPVVVGALADPAPAVRAQAALALGRLGDARPTTVAALERMLADGFWWSRANAAAALAALGPRGRRALERALQAPDPYARERARETLELHPDGDVAPAVERLAA